MNKVICDVCGTDYPETEPRCPICDCVRVDGGQTFAGNTEDNTYTYTKGGRFSKSNVKKRLKAKQISEETLLLNQTSVLDEEEEETDDFDSIPEDEEYDEAELNNKGLIIVVVVLLLAIVAVASYLVINYWKPITERAGMTQSTYDSIQEIPCTGLKYAQDSLELSAEVPTVNLTDSVICEPANTTDVVIFSSGDEAVLTVDDNGVVTAVASGRTVITISCGDVEFELDVLCDLGDVKLELISEEILLDGTTPTVQLYEGIWNASDITWTSDDESVAIVVDGKVEPVSVGVAEITAEYKGQKTVCNVVVHQTALDKLGGGSEPGTDEPGTDEPGTDEPGTDEPGTDEPGTDEPGTDEPGTDEPGTDEPMEDVVLKLQYSDVTLDGVYPSLQLYKGKLDPSEIKWTSSKESVATVKNGLVTAVSLGSTKITAEYKGQKATCMIHVSQSALDKLGIGSGPATSEPEQNTVLKLLYSDVTLDAVYPTLQLYKGDLNASEITWTSSKESVATVKNGLVTAVSVGSTVITAEYQGKTVTCAVHVSQAAIDKLNGNQQDSETNE